MTKLKLASEILKTLVVIAFAIWVLMLMGCASQRTPDEIEYRNAQIMEAHRLCYQQHVKQRRTFYSLRLRRLGRPPTPQEALMEIKDNGCYQWVKAQGFDL